MDSGKAKCGDSVSLFFNLLTFRINGASSFLLIPAPSDFPKQQPMGLKSLEGGGLFRQTLTGGVGLSNRSRINIMVDISAN